MAAVESSGLLPAAAAAAGAARGSWDRLRVWGFRGFACWGRMVHAGGPFRLHVCFWETQEKAKGSVFPSSLFFWKGFVSKEK